MASDCIYPSNRLHLQQFAGSGRKVPAFLNINGGFDPYAMLISAEGLRVFAFGHVLLRETSFSKLLRLGLTGHRLYKGMS